MKLSRLKLGKIAKEYQIADIYLFGSQVSGFQRKESDLDIGIRFKKGLPGAKERGKIYGNLFSDLIFCFRNKKIDLVFIDEAPLHFQFKIVAEGKLIYSEETENSLDFKEKIINYYRDHKYFIDEYFQGTLETAIQK